MKQLADLFEKLDDYFEGKSATERLALILLPAVLVGYLAWTMLNPAAEAIHNKSTADKKRVQKKLAEEKNYIRSITKNNDKEYYIKDYTRKTALAKKSADSYRNKISVLEKNLYKLSDMLFNQKSWSLFLDSITTRAHNNDVIINTISNKFVDSNGSFGHVLEVGIVCQGSISGIVRFMNDMEQNTLVTDIYQSRIYTEENSTSVNADINISVWGINH